MKLPITYPATTSGLAPYIITNRRGLFVDYCYSEFLGIVNSHINMRDKEVQSRGKYTTFMGMYHDGKKKTLSLSNFFFGWCQVIIYHFMFHLE
jgi:hypothetical protein